MTSAQILSAAALLGVCWAALPVPLPGSSGGPLNEQCLTVSDSARLAMSLPDAIGVLERCSALYPNDVELLADLGAAYESTERAVQAERIYRDALAIDPAYADLRLRLGRLMLRRGAVDEARREAEMGLLVQPNRQALRDLRDGTRAAASPGRP